MFGNIIRQLVEQVRSLKIRDSEDIIVLSSGPDGVTLGVSEELKRGSGHSPVMASASGDSEYSGPFAVVKKDDTTVTILGYHADEDRNWKNYVYAGLTATEVAEQDKGSLGAASGYLYLDVTYSSGYSVAVGFATSVPAQSATHYYHPLAWIACADSKISSVLQMQYGQVFIAGRVV